MAISSLRIQSQLALAPFKRDSAIYYLIFVSALNEELEI